MKDFPFRLEPLGAEHDRSSFHCGEEALDRYFRERVTQDVYTLTATSVLLADLPEVIAAKISCGAGSSHGAVSGRSRGTGARNCYRRVGRRSVTQH